MPSIKIGTRPSHLAIAQAELVARRLEEEGHETIIVKISSTGDFDLKTPLFRSSGTGVFVNEINSAVQSGNIDIAVHSAKDIPSAIPAEMSISGVLPRASYYDVLVAGCSLDELERGAVVGTSSIRRIKELNMVRPDLKVRDIRGNIDTRVKKQASGEYDAIILAEAGIERMGIKPIYQRLPLEVFMPAANQGIIAMVSRKDSPYNSLIAEISDQQTARAMDMERTLMTELQLGCSMPAGILAKASGEVFELRCRLYSIPTREYRDCSSSVEDNASIGKMAARIKESVPRHFGYSFEKS